MIYVHVPFCETFCTYCGFYSELCGAGKAEAYAKAVCKEIHDRAEEFDDSLRTLYFGGGTPSKLPVKQLTEILLALESVGHGGPYAEFTMEVNPEDIVVLGPSYLESLKLLGVDRISIGVQSFNDDMLRWMNRRHNAARAEEAFRMVREAGFANVSLDLMFGMSNLEDSVWEETVDKALALRPEHISCYQLSIEDDTPLADMIQSGKYAPMEDEKCWKQYYTLCSKANQAGYSHYEISNFALPGFESVHNSGYWQRIPYVGLGPSAHSYLGNRRSWNSSVISGYRATSEELSPEDIRVENIMLSLRTARGIDASYLFKNCSESVIDSLVGEGALVRQGGRFRIPESRFFVSDEIIRELI